MSVEPLHTLLARVRDGDDAARDRLFELLYDDLRQRARFEVARAGRADLDTTAVVHEAYLRLSGASGLTPEDRGHFLRIAARAMRYVLVDHARRRLSQKRGGDMSAVSLNPDAHPVESAASRLVALDEALLRLESRDERLAQVVHLRYFAGLSIAETAQALGVSERTVKRDGRMARAILHSELGDEPDRSEDGG